MSRRRQFGSIRQLPSGRWQARYVGPDGITYRAPDTFDTKGDAGRYLDAIRTRMGEGLWLDPEKSGQSLETYARSWIAQRSPRGRPLAVRTTESYTSTLNLHIAPTIGRLPLSKVTPAIVRSWYSALVATGKLSAATKAYSFLHAVFATAVDDDAVHQNPCRIKGAGQPKTPEQPLIDLHDLDRLTDAMPEHLRALTTLAFWACLRIGEVVALRRGDIWLSDDLSTGKVRIDRGDRDQRRAGREGAEDWQLRDHPAAEASY